MTQPFVSLPDVINSSLALSEQEKKEFIGVLGKLPERLQVGLIDFFSKDQSMIKVLYENYQSKRLFRSDPVKWSGIVEKEFVALLKQEHEMMR